MIRCTVFCVAIMACANTTVFAADLDGQIDTARSSVEQTWQGETKLQIMLSQTVPFRVYALEEPERLVVDFKNSAWNGNGVEDFASGSDAIEAARFGATEPGWSRLVADLSGPYLPYDVSMTQLRAGGAVLSLTLAAAEPETFSSIAGAPEASLWPKSGLEKPIAPSDDDRFIVVLDPGHGGIDPGAERQGVSEKALMLAFAFEVRAALLALDSVDVVMTRQTDRFVSLQSRVAQAHRAQADLFLSLHADALSQGGAQGATVYTLSREASDAASAQLAARHNRADVLAGIDLTGSDDEVTGVLLDLARQETEPRSRAFARNLVSELGAVGGPVNNRPLRSAGFTVLKSADIPSVCWKSVSCPAREISRT